jgi:CxxC-x17-CxxC domain-containing protein
MSYADKTLTCRDCGNQFVFTAGEQEFYAQKGFANEPTRCPDCRRARKSSGGGGGGQSRGYDSGDSYGGYGGGGGGRSSGAPRASGERTLFTTTCANCGKECQVPFVPRGSKPVLCDDCFRKQRAGSRY